MENIRLARPGAADAEVLEAASHACVHDFAGELPQSYHTVVDERGARLSAGQTQRIAVTRALLRRPAVLIMDEATSAADAATEGRIQDNVFSRAREDGTCLIIITHNPSTMRLADRIVVIENGAVAESGTFEDLERCRGALWRLTRSPGEMEWTRSGHRKAAVQGMNSMVVDG